MLRAEFESVAESSPEALHEAYLTVLRETVERAGVDTVAERADVERETVRAVADAEKPELTVETAAAILATDPERPDADTVEAEALDILLMGMTTAVVDVDALAAGVDAEMDPKEVQQKVEGRHPVALAEYAAIQAFLEGEG